MGTPFSLNEGFSIALHDKLEGKGKGEKKEKNNSFFFASIFLSNKFRVFCSQHRNKKADQFLAMAGLCTVAVHILAKEEDLLDVLRCSTLDVLL